jgi:hypothetical protein
MAQADGALGLARRLAQVARRREDDIRRVAPLEEVEQRRDQRESETEERERLEEDHRAARRSAWPNGVVVVMWW